MRIRRSAAAGAFVTVHLELFAGLGRYLPGPGPVRLEVDEGVTVRELLDALGVPADEARLIFVNHRAADPAQVLREGDRIGAFPLIAGG